MAKEFRPASRPATAGGSPKPLLVVADVDDPPIEDEDALLIYRWLDSLEFSRTKKTSANRDFADGVMMAELIAHYIPKIINATYFVKSSSSSKKIGNWEHLNNKIFKRIGFQLTPELIQELAAARPGMIERVLKPLQPILLKGNKAVLPLLKRMENVKPRFMDFDKSYLRKKPERPKTAEATAPARPSSRPRSAVASSAPSRQRTPSRAKNSLNPVAPPPSAATAPEFEVIKDPRSSRGSLSRERSQKIRSRPLSAKVSQPDAFQVGVFSGENYGIFTRPSSNEPPRNSYNEAPSPNDILTGIHNLKEQMDQQAQQNLGGENDTISSTKKRGFPARTSWLPVEGDNQLSGKNFNHNRSDHNTNTNVLTDTEDEEDAIRNNFLNQVGNEKGIDEEEADDEIYCDQSGYEEDTEDNDHIATDIDDDEDVFLPSSGDRTNTDGKRPKRKLKRVVKYEYREEYILNGMASFQLPNSAQLENVRKNYMSPGNNDPNCRGYGFV